LKNNFVLTGNQARDPRLATKCANLYTTRNTGLSQHLL